MTSIPESGLLPGDGVLTYRPGSSLADESDPNVHLDRLARSRLRILDSTTEGIYQIDVEGRCTFMNRAACCLLGYQFGEAIGKKLQRLHHGRSVNQSVHAGDGRTQGDIEQPLPHEATEGIFRRSDGLSFPVEYCAHPVFENGVQLGEVITFHDISERKRNERRLKTQHAVSRALESTASIEAIMPLVLRALGESLGLGWGALWQVDEQESALRLSAIWRGSPSGFEHFEEVCRSARFARGQNLPGTVWESGEAILLSELTGYHSSHNADARAAGFRSGLALPVRMTQDTFGVIEFFSADHVPPDPDLVGTLALLGSAIGQVIERKRSEAVRTRLAAILDAATDFVGFVIDPGGTILSVSRSAESIFGFTPAELYHQPLSILIPDYRAHLQDNGWAEDLSPCEFPSRSIRMRGRRRSGSFVPLEVSLGDCVESGSRVIAGVIRDVTERVASEETLGRQAEDLRLSEGALRHQSRLVNSIVTSMADGVIAADENGEIILFNPAASNLIGDRTLAPAPDRGLLADPDYLLLLPDQRTPYTAEQLPLSRAVRGETIDAIELFAKTPQRPDGFWLNGTARPMMDNDGLLRGGVLVLRDVTEQKTSREALRRAKEEAEAANRAKSEFLSRMSHELRTPMNAILGFAQLLENESLDSEQRDAITRILKAARHLLALINEVLDISRIEAGRLNLQTERLRPWDAMQAAIELIGSLAAQRQIELVAPPSSDAQWCIEADRQLLTQVFVNLLGNAVKYNRERGLVRVSFEKTAEQNLRIKIADTGVGLSAAQISKLFVPFERLGAERSGIEGTGLGLAYSNRLVTAMGGRIGVESEIGKGSVFWVEAPLAASESRSAHAPVRVDSDLEDRTDKLDRGVTKVLCIQDDPTSFREIEKIFNRLPGYGLISAQWGSTGLKAALEQAPELVLLDLHLQDITQIDILKELQSQTSIRHTPIIVLSAGLTEETRQRALDAGAYGCLSKPIKARTFLDTIAGLI